MSWKTAGMIIAIVGLLVALISALAGVIGLGDPKFGAQQIAGTVAGVVILIIGIVVYLRPGRT